MALRFDRQGADVLHPHGLEELALHVVDMDLHPGVVGRDFRHEPGAAGGLGKLRDLEACLVLQGRVDQSCRVLDQVVQRAPEVFRSAGQGFDPTPVSLRPATAAHFLADAMEREIVIPPPLGPVAASDQTFGLGEVENAAIPILVVLEHLAEGWGFQPRHGVDFRLRE